MSILGVLPGPLRKVSGDFHLFLGAEPLGRLSGSSLFDVDLLSDIG